MVVIAARGDEDRLIAVAGLLLEPKDVAPKPKSTVNVSNLEVYVADVHTGLDGSSRHTRRLRVQAPLRRLTRNEGSAVRVRASALRNTCKYNLSRYLKVMVALCPACRATSMTVAPSASRVFASIS
jgi:hypothetical protein